jgi:hypothetical protein
MVLRLGVEVSRAEAYKLRPKAKKEGRHDPEKRALVQVPGTAPRSNWSIATAIYFHSQRTGTANIGSKD